MEIKINKEIRRYQENIFFGLSVRQFICSLLALGMAAGVYFLLKKPLGEETVSWLCILAAVPVAAMGFFQYNTLTMEQFILAWFKSEFLFAGPRKFVAENYYLLAMSEENKLKDRKKEKPTAKQAAQPAPPPPHEEKKPRKKKPTRTVHTKRKKEHRAYEKTAIDHLMLSGTADPFHTGSGGRKRK